MVFALGSENPVKRRALSAALDRLGLEAEVRPLPVPGAPAQPLSEAATEEGAAYRAWHARRALEADWGVGLEGGVDLESGWLTMYAALTNGEALYLGRGPGLPLPEAALRAVAAGRTLGDWLKETYGSEAASLGAIGALTTGALDRQAAFEAALLAALGQALRSGALSR